MSLNSVYLQNYDYFNGVTSVLPFQAPADSLISLRRFIKFGVRGAEN